MLVTVYSGPSRSKRLAALRQVSQRGRTRSPRALKIHARDPMQIAAADGRVEAVAELNRTDVRRSILYTYVTELHSGRPAVVLLDAELALDQLDQLPLVLARPRLDPLPDGWMIPGAGARAPIRRPGRRTCTSPRSPAPRLAGGPLFITCR